MIYPGEDVSSPGVFYLFVFTFGERADIIKGVAL